MSIIDDCVKFLEDLILGDFNEQQMVSAQLIGGLVSLIPVMDQVMDARDISGCLYRINKRGGFAKASLEQKVDLGFAAFGVIPEIGSAFKTVFKPLYKQRKAARGVINSGVAMIERMLGHKKGGAVRWVRALDWAGNTQLAIVQANLALESCIQLLDYLAQSRWWCPDRLERLAGEIAPTLKALRGKLAAPIREAAEEIRKFLEGLLGEHAAAVAMSVALNAPAARRSSTPARPARTSGAPATARHTNVAESPRVKAKTSDSRVTNAVQRTSFDIYAALDNGAKGLMGEHIVEHHIIEKKNWGMQWNRHDMSGPQRGGQVAGWQSVHRKINDREIPTYLCNPKTQVFIGGIDSLWLTNRGRPHEFAIVEAKAHINPNIQLYQLLGEAQSRDSSPRQSATGPMRRRSGNSPQGKPQPTAKPPVTKVMQMSENWINDRINEEFRQLRGRIANNFTKHVFLVTPLQASEHMDAMSKIIDKGFVGAPASAQQFASLHDDHDVQREFNEADLNDAERKYATSGKYKPTTPRRPRRPRK